MTENQSEWNKGLDIIIQENWSLYPFLKEVYTDNSISYSIKKEKFQFWISSTNNEYSIGFNNMKNECTWHTHMSLCGANTIEEQAFELARQIRNILNSIVKIVINKEDEIVMLDNSEDKEFNLDKALEFKYWGELS